MKLLTRSVVLFTSALALISCNEESWVGQAGKGGIRLNLQASGDVKDAVPMLRASEEVLQVPEAGDFSIKLEKTGGTESRTWESLESFGKEDGFATGSYTLTAYYGSENEEGFEKPYFKGESQVNVLEGRETAVDVVATLANSMISIDYTDAFKGYFSSWSAQVHSEGHDYIEYVQTETRPAFVCPGEIAVGLTLTDGSGRTVTLQPAAFAAEGRHHYHITFDVNNGQVGTTQLVIKFDDSIIEEDVNIDLTEELFTTPAPEVKSSGFTDGQRIEVLEGVVPDEPYKFQILARAGLKDVVLTVNSESYTPSFGSEIDLMTCTEMQRQQLEASGVDCKGLWKNPDQWALIDITSFCSSLPAGSHQITLLAKDRFTRASSPVSLNIVVEAVSIAVQAQDVVYGNETAIVDVTSNATGFENDITFKSLNNYGAWESCSIVSCEQLQTRASDTVTYRYVISIFNSERSSLPIAVYYKGALAKETTANVVVPTYQLDVDAYAKSAEINVIPDEAENLKGIVENMRIYVGGQKVPESNLTRNSQTGVISLAGLKGSTEYVLQTALLDGNEFATDQHFTTEAEAGVPNGDFESTHQTINNVTINQGGTWSDISHWSAQQTKATFNVFEPEQWATVNAKTFNTSAKALNTWFVFPSTLNVADAKSGSNAMLLRSVGYNYSGTVPGRSTNTGSHSYSGNVPARPAIAAGKLFLGSYSIDTGSMSETYTQGVNFGSRPASLQGYYKYSSLNDDKGIVTVEFYSGSELIATGKSELASAGSYTAFNVPLTYSVRGMKATSVRVMFASSNKASMNHEDETANVPANSVTSETYQSFIGSQLTIDNLSFSYSRPTFKAVTKKVVRKKVVRKK